MKNSKSIIYLAIAIVLIVGWIILQKIITLVSLILIGLSIYYFLKNKTNFK